MAARRFHQLVSVMRPDLSGKSAVPLSTVKFKLAFQSRADNRVFEPQSDVACLRQIKDRSGTSVWVAPGRALTP
jgi:hypothetical protein